jgi:hypothetical protein
MVDPGPGLDMSRLKTDRSAYLSFLEIQLERVSSACLTVQGFHERIDQVRWLFSVAPGGDCWSRTRIHSLVIMVCRYAR